MSLVEFDRDAAALVHSDKGMTCSRLQMMHLIILQDDSEMWDEAL